MIFCVRKRTDVRWGPVHSSAVLQHGRFYSRCWAVERIEMRSLTRLLTAAVLTASAAAAMAQDLPQTSVTPSKSRAEVMADLEMYQRAGLGYMPTPAAYVETEFSSEYRKAYAEYQRLLASPAYTAAVAKYQSQLGGQ